ncbi:hypothetical protein TNCV_4492481 [Trichonephila clavipes]|nr:hypothetical protein TNCV_4492481 [Trichonephila clavipes]
MLVRLSRAPVLSGGLRRKTQLFSGTLYMAASSKTPPHQSKGLWSGREEKKREIGMARKRAENRERSLGFPGFVKPVFTKDSKPLGKRSLGHLGSVKTRTHLKKVSPLRGSLAREAKKGGTEIPRAKG